MVDIRVFNKSQIEYEHPESEERPILLIFIEGTDWQTLQSQSFTQIIMNGFNQSIRLVFDDLCLTDKYAFTIKQAREIKNMVDLIKWKSIWVVCNQGISRSPAVAIALDEYLNKKKSDLIKNYPCYNPYVYKILSKELSKGGK